MNIRTILVLLKKLLNKTVIFSSLFLIILGCVGFLLYIHKFNSINYGGDLQPLNIPELIDSKTEESPIVITASNAEHELIEAVHQAFKDEVSGIIINPAAFTHTSIALRDALSGTQIPFVEVHLSNVFARESFRQKSYFSDLALGVISGFGASGYSAALNLLIQQLESN